MSEINIPQLTEQVKSLARETGHFIRNQRLSFSLDRVERKHPHDYVSYVDKQSEEMITRRLGELLPEAGFITEEQIVAQDNSNSEYCWIVDPLDGTTNFISNVPLYCVSIALRHNNQIIIGVVYEITRNELFWAYKDGGAWLDDTQIHVSDRTLDDALVLLGFPYNVKAYTKFQQRLIDNLYGRVASIRSFGSAEAELCYVAAGRLDVYIESFIKPWDVAAGSILVQEAGGLISDYDGQHNLWPSGRQVLATNITVHNDMLDIINKCILPTD